MLAFVAVLVFAVAKSDANIPKLWGSRVVVTQSGPSDTMNYEYGDNFTTQVRRDFVWGELTFEYGLCVLNKTYIWGRPCNKGGGYANITLKEVLAQKVMVIFNGSEPLNVASTTFFVPGCKFPRPYRDEVDLGASFPLSRFVGDMASFNITFALRGADSDSNATLAIGGKPVCTWMGTKLGHKGDEFCAPMVKDEEADLRMFRGVFQRKTNVSRETFVFAGSTTVLAVSVDYSQSGTSPEVMECNQYQGVTTKVTSSGPVAAQALGAIFGSLFMLLHW